MITAFRETFDGFKSLLTGMRITFGQAVKRDVTVQYPHETVRMPTRFRGHIKLLLDPETGLARCTACNLCARACPSECIVLDGAKREGEKRKFVSKYLLDFTKCSLCGSCVEVCPFDAIDFSREYNVVSLDRADFANMDLYRKVREEGESLAPTRAQAKPDVEQGGVGGEEPR